MNRRGLIWFVWGVTILASILPDIILQEVFKIHLPWLFWARVGMLAVVLAVTLAIRSLRSLWMYPLVLLVLNLSAWLFSDLLGKTAFWQARFGGDSFTLDLFGIQVLRLCAALSMIVLMLILNKRRAAFFLVKGDLRAAAAPIPLVMDKPAVWSKLGWILAVCISGGTLVFLLLAGRPSSAALLRAVPLLPAVIGLAVMNSFSEEMSYRAGPLAALHEVVGPGQALLLTGIFFGIGHYYGVPYGIAGVVMASLLGWLLGKAMLETRGFAWAWFIHFLQDVLIFSFMAIGSVVAGG